MANRLPAHLFCAAVNHLLAQDPGLAAMLEPYAGQPLQLELPLLALHLRIESDGSFAPLQTAAGEAFAARIRLAPGHLFRLPLQGLSALQAADTAGDAHFLDALNQVFSQLDWDTEADLTRLLGPLAGVRAARLVQRLLPAARHVAKTAFGNLADYATEEAGWLASRRDITRFNREVDQLADTLARLEARLKRLEQG